MSGFVHTMTSDELALFAGIVAKAQTRDIAADARESILGDVLRLLRSDACVSFAWDNVQARFVEPRFTNVSSACVKKFEEHYQYVDTWAPRVRELNRPTPMERVVPTREFENSKVFREVLAPDGLYRILGLYVSQNGTQLGRLTVLRRRDSPEFEEREITLLLTLQPFLAGAFQRRQVKVPDFTPRERQVAQLVARGCTDREIARTLSIAFYTVRTHLSNAMQKSGCTNRTELAGFLSAHFATD